MEFGWTKEEEEFRREVDDFLRQEVTDELVKEVTSGLGYGPHTWEFLRKLGSKGWLCPHWPREYGGLDSSYMKKFIITERIAYYKGPYVHDWNYAGAVILNYGSEEQKKEYLPKIARGEIEFALGYTEPEAGTDLASLQMTAVRQGDEYIITGQKVFSSRAHYAQYHWLMVRTAPNVPKHKGLSLFIVDMKSPGITVRPLRGMGGVRTNQVFYDNVHVPAKNLVGKENRGWYQVVEALEHERVALALVTQFQHLIGELADYCRQTKRNGLPLSKDPLVRQKIAQMTVENIIGCLFSYRAAWILNRGGLPDYESALMKVFNTEARFRLFSDGLQILGLYGQLRPDSRWVQLRGTLVQEYEKSLSTTIGGGSNEILRNVIAQRGLGLPRA